MTVENEVSLSRKRSLTADKTDTELWLQPTLSAAAIDGLRCTSRPLFTEESDSEQKNRRKRVRMSEGDRATWMASPPEAGSDDDRGLDSECCEEHPTSSPRKAASLANQDPYVSFGEEADSVYRRIEVAAHKYHHALNSNKLLCRLHDLPTENEYVPRKMRDPTPTPPDSASTVVVIPSYYRRSPSEWGRMETENRERAKSFCARFGLKVVVNDSPPANLQLGDQNSMPCQVNPTYSSGKAALGATHKVDEDVNSASYKTTLVSTQGLTAPPVKSMLRESSEIGDRFNSGATELGDSITAQDETFQLLSSSFMGERQTFEPRARGTIWEGRLRRCCRESEKMGSVASRVSTEAQQSQSAPSSRKPHHIHNHADTSRAYHCKSKGEGCHKGTEERQTELQPHILGSYITPSPDHPTVEGYWRSSAQQGRDRDIHDTLDRLYGRSLAQALNSYATPSSRSSLEPRVWQRSKRKSKLKSKCAARQGRHQNAVLHIAEPISSRLRSGTSFKSTRRVGDRSVFARCG